MNRRIKKFWAEHKKGGSSHVVMVHVCAPDGGILHSAVFSDVHVAERWAEQLPDDGDIGACLFIPVIVDVPEYGNVPAKQRH